MIEAAGGDELIDELEIAVLVSVSPLNDLHQFPVAQPAYDLGLPFFDNPVRRRVAAEHRVAFVGQEDARVLGG